MNKTCLTASVAALLQFSFANICEAQSSVELYGRLDAGFEYKTSVQGSNGSRSKRFGAESGDWGATYLGLRGTETINADLSAIFNLEGGFNMMSGALTGGTGVLWGRMAWAGLASKRYGTVTVGRTLALPNDQWDMDPLMQEAISSTSLVHGRTAPVTNNTISYQTPTVHGLDVYAQYGLGNSANGFNTGAIAGGYGRTDGVQLTWRQGGLELRGQFDELRDANGRFSNVFVSSRELFAGAAWRVGRMTWQAGFSQLSAPDSPAGVADTAFEAWGGGKYALSPAWELQGAVFHVHVNSGAGDTTHDAAGHATMLALGTTYHLSARTFLYCTVAQVRNSAHATFGVVAANPGAANSNGDNPLPGHAQSGGYIGVMHYF